MLVETDLRPQKENQYNRTILVLSVLIPLALAVLFGMPKIEGYDFSFLPAIYATINGITALLLIAAFIAIRRGNQVVHRRLMKTCIGLSAVFLVLYVLYHITTDSTAFGGQGPVRYLYFFILITHILLSVGVVPFVLVTFARALSGNFERHKKLARYTFPLWLYVAVTGVLVYLMISPYYK